MAKCRSCGAEIRWARTSHGKLMPIEPDPEGAFALRNGRAVFVGKEDATDEPRYRSHFASCPNAAAHRKT